MAILRQQSDSFDADSVYNVGMCLLHGGHSIYEQVLGAEDCQRCASTLMKTSSMRLVNYQCCDVGKLG